MKSPQQTIIDEVLDLAKYTLNLEKENQRLIKQNKNYARGLAKLAKEKEDNKVRRN